MDQHLQAFLEVFLDKYHRKKLQSTPRSAKSIAQEKRAGNPLLGMDALYRELDERYCIQLPKGNKQNDIDFVRNAIAKYKLTTCYVLSTYEPFNQQTMPIGEALDKIIGTSSTTIISFIPGKVAYFEGHSIGDRYICIKDF